MKLHVDKRLSFCAMLLVSGVLFVPGCFKKSDKTAIVGDATANSSDVLLSIDGKPALTVSEYEEQLAMARKANPQIDQFLEMMPNAEKEFIFQGMTTGRLVKAWCQKHGIDKTEEFQRELRVAREAIELNLYLQHFEKANPITVSDSELQKFYDEKKNVIPGLVQAQGGTEISYVRLENKAAAQAFMDKVKGIKKADTFAKVAEENKQQVVKSTVNEKSPMAPAVKSAVLDITKFPSVDMVKVSDDVYWVFIATNKTETKYRDLNDPQVEQGLRKMASDERRQSQLTDMMDGLKKELNVVENTSYIDKKAQTRASALEQKVKMMEQNKEA